MAKKLRKMLGSIDSPECIGLMRLIETQSKETLAKWAIGYAQENYLPVYEKMGERDCFARAVDSCKALLAGDVKLTDVKPLLKEAREAAAKETDPIAQAAARAVATACAVVTTPTNALGYLFYGAAVFAYTAAGLEASAGEYDALASQEMARALDSLHSAAVENEPNPAKIDWNC